MASVNPIQSDQSMNPVGIGRLKVLAHREARPSRLHHGVQRSLSPEVSQSLVAFGTWCDFSRGECRVREEFSRKPPLGRVRLTGHVGHVVTEGELRVVGSVKLG